MRKCQTSKFRGGPKPPFDINDYSHLSLAARHSVFNDPRKHSGKIFKSEISSNLAQKMLVLRLICFYFYQNVWPSAKRRLFKVAFNPN